MSRPIVFSGKDAKLLTPRDLVGSDGNVFPKTGEKNYVNSPSAYTNSSTTLLWGVTGAGITAATDTTVADLPRPNTSKTGILLTGVSGSTAYAYYRFVLDDADAGKKLKVQFDMKPGTMATSDFKVDVYSNTASDYSTGNARLALSTDSSAVSLLPVLTGTYRTTFDAPAITAKWIEIRIGLNQAHVHTLCISDVVVGPGVVVQGAAVGPWIAYTPSVTGQGSKVFTTYGVYRRVGDTMEVEIFATGNSTAAGAAGNAFALSLPAGFTINVAALAYTASPYTDANLIGSGFTYGVTVASQYDYGISVVPDSAATVHFLKPATNTYYTTTDLNVARSMQFDAKFTVPINEWAGSGTVNVVQNDVEYVYNTSSTDADDSTSFGYGPGGGAIGSFTAARNKRVRFLTPISATDKIEVEINSTSGSGTTWTPLYQTRAGNLSYQNQTGVLYGIGIVEINATDVDVQFETYAKVGNGTYGTAGAAWSTLAGYQWRVKRSRGGQAVGFSEVVPGTSAGLVGAAGLKGSATGSAIATSYVGEVIESHVVGSNSLTSNVMADLTTITMKAGVWDVFYSCFFTRNGATMTNTLFIAGLSTSAGDVVPIQRYDTYQAANGTWSSTFSTGSLTGYARVRHDGTNFLDLGGTTPTGTTLRLKIGEANFTGGPVLGYGALVARRVA